MKTSTIAGTTTAEAEVLAATAATLAAGGDPFGDGRLAADVTKAGHARLECADPRHDQTVGGQCGITVRGHRHRCPHPLERALRRAEVTRTVVQDHHRWFCHRTPLVDGTPTTRGSGSTAWRRARATALYCASVM